MANSTNDDQRLADLTREALADVSEGLVIDHALVETWAQSLDTDTPVPLPTQIGLLNSQQAELILNGIRLKPLR